MNVAERVDPPGRQLFWALLAVGAALSLAACIGIATQALVVGSARGGWVYPYVQPFTVEVFAVALLASVLVAAMMLVGPHPEASRPWMVLLVWMLVAAGVQSAVRVVAPVTMESAFVSDSANSFYSVTQRHEPGELLARFDRIRTRSPLHAQSNMPGKTLLLYALQVVSARTDVLPWLVVALSNAAALLMYVFVRDLFRDSRTALYSAILYLFVPARLAFLPLMNTVTPVLVLGFACLLQRAIRPATVSYALLGGVALYALVFFEPLPLVMGLLFAGLVLAAVARAESSWKRLLRQVVIGGFAFIATSELVAAWTGFELSRTVRLLAAHAVRFNETAARPYDVWVRANLGEFVFGMGFCQAAVFLGVSAYGLRGPGSLLERMRRPITALCLGLLAVLFALDLIGVNRGEVIRLWIFLACFFQIPVAWACATLNSRPAMALVVAAAVLQGSLATAMIAFVIP